MKVCETFVIFASFNLFIISLFVLLYSASVNRKHFDSVLKSILRLALEDDITLQKQCVLCLSKMVDFWAESPGSGAANAKPGLPGFNQFILQQILPLCFQIPLKPTFNVNDGQAHAVSFILVPFPPFPLMFTSVSTRFLGTSAL